MTDEKTTFTLLPDGRSVSIERYEPREADTLPPGMKGRISSITVPLADLLRFALSLRLDELEGLPKDLVLPISEWVDISAASELARLAHGE